MKSFLTVLCLLVPALSWAQTSLSSGPVFGTLERDQVKRRISLQPARLARWENLDVPGPYLLNQSTNTFLAGGIAAQLDAFALPLNLSSSGWMSTGIYPTRATQVVSVRVHEDYQAPALPWPATLENFNQWRVGDNLFWRRDKGVGVYLGVGASLVSVGPVGVSISAGPKFLRAGIFQVYLEKKSASQLYLEVRPGETRTAAMLGSLVVFTGEAGVTEEVFKDGHGLLIDPRTLLGREVFKLAMQGRLQEAEFLLNRDSLDGNTVVSHMSQRRHIGYAQWSVRVPLIPIFSYTRRTATTSTDWELEEDSVLTQGHQLDYTRSTLTLALQKYVGEVRGIRFMKDQAGRTHLAYRWEWEHNAGGPRSLHKALARLRKRLDCHEACEFSTSNVRARLGYLRANATWQIELSELESFTSQNRALVSINRQVKRCNEHGASRACLRLLARYVMALKTPLKSMFSTARACVPLAFSVGGEKLKQWSAQTSYCP